MITKVELDTKGVKVRIYHRTDGGQQAWVHAYEDKANCEVCQKEATR